MPTAAPAPNPTAPIRVAECRRCGQLFAVYAMAGDIACPACEATSSVASLEIVELSVATPVAPPVETPKPAPAPLAVPAPAIEVAETVAPEEPVAETAAAISDADSPQRPPTVAEWLLQSEQSTPRAADARLGERPTEAKRSLAESLGWTPGSFDVESLATPHEEAASAPADTYTDAPHETATFADSLKDFRFDFGATPLSEPEEADANEGVSLELSTESSAAAEEAPQPLRLDALVASKPHSRGWGNFLGMAIGLMLVAGPAAYFAATWESGDPAAELASADGDLFTEDMPVDSREPAAPVDDDAFASRAIASSAPAGEATPPKSIAAADPFLDSATKPASFDKRSAGEPEFDLPPSAPREVTRPAAMVEDSVSGAAGGADPFFAKPQAAEPVATPSGDGRYAASAEVDRYATTPAEPAEFAPPEEAAAAPSEDDAAMPVASRDEMIEPVTAIAEPRPFDVAPKQTGLVNAPKYGARELAEAFSPAEAAAVGFATGSLDDQAQVSTMGQHYAHLCHLAQVVTLLDTNDPSLMTAELQATDTFKRVMRDERSRAQSRQIAGPWIAWTGRPHGGVFFAGMPADLRRAGDVIQYEFSIGDSVVPVVMAEPIDAKRFAQTGASEVGVIGVVVENPRQWIAGYEGDAERVVWARKTLPLPRVEAP